MRSFTLFESDDPNNAYSVRTNILTTRLYLVVLAISMITFSIFILATRETSTITVEHPTMIMFERLHVKYFDTLICPCTQLSIKIRQVLSMDPVYHQLCSSIFVSRSWIDHLRERLSSMSHQFLLLKSLCQNARDTIQTALVDFLDDSVITGNTLSRLLFRSQIEAAMSDIFLSTTEGSFKRSLDLIRTNTHANQILSGLFTNWKIQLAYYDDVDKWYTRNRPVSYGTNYGCSCHLSATCKAQYQLNQIISNETFHIPGFYYGCFILESLFQSTLECFYNQTCLDTLVDHLDSTETLPKLVALTNNASSIANETIESIVEELMVTDWQSNISFENYYHVCHPSVCTYSINRNHTLAYLIPAFIALYGGLVFILDFLVPLVMKDIRRRRNRVMPQA